MKISELKGQDIKARRVDWYYKKRDVAEDYIKGRFSNPLGRYHHKKQINFINRIIKEYKIRRVLDLACGPARIGADLKGFGEAYGVDASNEMLNIAKKRTRKWKFFKRSAFNLKFKPEYFDLIVSLRFIRHLKKDRRCKVYKQIWKVLKKKGLFILDAVNYDKDYYIRRRKGFHKYKVYDELYKKSELIKELEENGFKVIEIENVFNNIYLSTAISKIFFTLRLNEFGSKIINLVDKIKTKNPLEWIVLCQK